MSGDVLLEAVGLTRRYGERTVVRDLSLALRRGECLGLLGLNGAGKSTTLRMLTGVLAPDAGRVLIGGLDLARAPLAARKLLGYLPEVPPLYPDARVDEYLQLCAELHAVSAPGTAVAAVKSRCGLEAVGSRLIRHLSKGYQQRVGIAQALVHNPPVIVLDEPTVGLDPRQISELRTLIRELIPSHAIVLSSHQLPEVQQVCTRVAVLSGGELIHEGLPMASGHEILLEVSRGLGVAKVLGQVDGVLSVVHEAGTGYRIALFDPALVETIARIAVERDWGLEALRPADSQLEATFLALTAGAG